ncbi:hypothetical protein GS393_05382 [Pseudomonas savastanoi pv. phaseolicola]|nr:hypothetical protein [Pseudomonas savastanoi pv. phaseolicola]RMQ61826.1 hypothetical protein ALQ02_200034 [Pseudomonas savastanoi pv. phaseolicola]
MSVRVCDVADCTAEPPHVSFNTAIYVNAALVVIGRGKCGSEFTVAIIGPIADMADLIVLLSRLLLALPHVCLRRLEVCTPASSHTGPMRKAHCQGHTVVWKVVVLRPIQRNVRGEDPVIFDESFAEA